MSYNYSSNFDNRMDAFKAAIRKYQNDELAIIQQKSKDEQ